MVITKLQVLEALKKIIYPDYQKNIVDSHLIKSVKTDGEDINLTLYFPHEGQKHVSDIEQSCRQILHDTFGTSVNIIINSEIKNDNEFIAHEGGLKNVKNIIAVASGKGGVGKSTIATNLAVSLSRSGANVGLIDADIFGPSLPVMLGAESMRPSARKIDGKEVIIPVKRYGVKMISIGFFVEPDNAAIWRGPMASGAFKQFFTDTDWGNLDYLLVDLPPGTSDIHLTLVQTVGVTGAVIVSTPQKVAIADAVKGISMFRAKHINVPVLGLIENMAWFTPAELPENKYYIFGKEGCRQLAADMNVTLLGQIPIVQSIREGGDEGRPESIDENSPAFNAFRELTKNFVSQVIERNKNLPPTKKVMMKKM
jgi:ATP-binding protein involved in chromosome partitioning